MKVSMTQRVMLANRRKVMICLPGLATCWALVVHTLRAVSLITMPATKDQLLPNEMAFFLSRISCCSKLESCFGQLPFNPLNMVGEGERGWKDTMSQVYLKGNNLASDQKQVIPTPHLPKPVDQWLPSTNIIYVRQKNVCFYFQFSAIWKRFQTFFQNVQTVYIV